MLHVLAFFVGGLNDIKFQVVSDILVKENSSGI
jgi:hypothetical protein